METRDYDARGKLVRAVDADGEVRLRGYDVMGRLLTETIGDPAKRTPMTVKRNSYDPYGRLAETTVNGVRAAFRYDEVGRLTRKLQGYDPTQRDAALMRQDLSYTARDEVETATDKRGEGTHSIYDERGRVVARETLFNGKTLARRETGYDPIGRPVRVVDERGSATCTSYDDYGRVSSITPPGLGTKGYSYTLDARHPVTGKPTHSLRTRLTAATGETFDTYVDGMGRNWLTGASANGYQQTTYVDGRATRIERIGLDGATAAIKLYSYNDRSNRVARETDWFAPADEAACAAGGANCPAGAVAFAYTAGGRQVSRTDAAGNATVTHFTEDGAMLPALVDASGFAEVRFEYDPNYPVVVARERGPHDDPIRSEYKLDRYLYQTGADTRRKTTGEHEHVDYSYDASGHRLSATLHRDGRSESRLSWTYDDYGRTASKTLEVANAKASGSGKIGWQYAPTGQLALVMYPSGNQVAYDYDNNGLLQRITSGFGPAAKTIAAYDKPDASGRYLSARIADALTVKHVYDGGHESERSILTGAGDIAESYRYDALGRLTEAKRRGGAGATLAYDVRDQLTFESRDDPAGPVSLSYGHDVLGRRISKTATTGAGADRQDYGYGSGSRLQMVTGAPAAIAWDAFDRPQNDQHDNRFVWGLADHLRSIKTPDGRQEDMLFDADGQRVARAVGGVVDLYYSSDLSGEVYTQKRADGGFVDVVRDPNGGVVALLNEKGEIIPWTADKGDRTMAAGAAGRALGSAFGDVERSSLPEGLGFHQSWGSALTSLRFAGVRVYDPETGRFLTPDPLGAGSAIDPNHSVDLFQYAQNNPVALRDSTGYLGITPPSPTTIIVDGVAIETFNVNSWSNGTIRVANYAAYIAGVRAGIKAGLAQGWTLDQAVQYAIGNGPPSSAQDDKGQTTSEARSGGVRPRFFAPFTFLTRLFAGQALSAGAPRLEQESDVHAKASTEALDQARSGGPANGQFIDENGKIVRQVSGADPTSRAYWLRVKGPNGEEVLGADTPEIISKFFAENPGYKPASRIFSAGDVLTVEVSPPQEDRPGIVRFGSGVFKAARGAVVEAYNFMIHDNFGAWITMGRCAMG